MKKSIVACISFILLIFIMILSICLFMPDTLENDSDKIHIVATLFPQYDLATQVAGDKAVVKLLVEPGIETHTYEPTARDMMTIMNNTDIFLYTGLELEPWTENIVENLNNVEATDESEVENTLIVNVAEKVDLIKQEEFEENHINPEIDHRNSNNHDDSHEGHNHDEHLYDAHIWQNPKNAEKMLDAILEALIEVDPVNRNYYETNAAKYRDEIRKLDTDLQELVNNAEKKEIAIGGEFAYAYLIEEYDLKFVSVYSNCGHGEDPSITKVKSVIDYTFPKNIKVSGDYEEVLKYIDLVILDIKHTEPLGYKELTNLEISEVEQFIKELNKSNKPVWIRQVIVPGINDTEEYILELKKYISKINNIEKIELLPYHTLGKEKYQKLNIKYRLEETIDMDKDRCKELEKTLNK